ncbi:MAG: asparagine synthase [Frankiales bacterium]|nr:asparagine synthase [Frankiales bacterium]
MTAPLPPLDPLEIAAGGPLGHHSGALPLPRATLAPRAAFEQAVLRGLLRPPLFVSFSGGRDSSAVLAVAVAVARREGLPLPVPVTLDVVGSPDADEREWQQLVLDHLGLDEGVRLPVRDELGVTGPVAAAVLRRHGLLAPANAYMQVPLLEVATGGSLVTGIGGDEVLGSSGAMPTARVLAGLQRPTRRELKHLAAGVLLPRTYRRTVLRRRIGSLPWLTPLARELVGRRGAACSIPEHSGWAAELANFARQRVFAHIRAALDTLSADHDVVVHNPFLDRDVLAALGAAGGRGGLGGRSAAMTRLFGDLLPEPVLTRSSKAFFDEAVDREPTLGFRQGEAIDHVRSHYVDRDALRALWSGPSSHYPTMLLLQDAWLRSQAA